MKTNIKTSAAAFLLSLAFLTPASCGGEPEPAPGRAGVVDIGAAASMPAEAASSPSTVASPAVLAADPVPGRCSPDPTDLDLSNAVCPGAPARYPIPCGLCRSVSRGAIVGCTMTVDLIARAGDAPIATPLWVCVGNCATDCPSP